MSSFRRLGKNNASKKTTPNNPSFDLSSLSLNPSEQNLSLGLSASGLNTDGFPRNSNIPKMSEFNIGLSSKVSSGLRGMDQLEEFPITTNNTAFQGKNIRHMTTSLSKTNDNEPIVRNYNLCGGCKTYVNNQILVSTGNRDFDGILGGGLVLGSITLIEEDRFSDHAITLLKYFLAQGISSHHLVLHASPYYQQSASSYQSSQHPEVGGTNESLENKGENNYNVNDLYNNFVNDIFQTLPRNITLNPIAVASSNNPNEKSIDNSDQNRNVNSNPEKMEEKKDMLKVAWQYKKYLKEDEKDEEFVARNSNMNENKKEGQNFKNIYRHSYNLSRLMEESDFIVKPIRFNYYKAIIDTDSSLSSKLNYKFHYYEDNLVTILQQIKKLIRENYDNHAINTEDIKVMRIALESFGSLNLTVNIEEQSSQIGANKSYLEKKLNPLMFLLELKKIIRNYPIVVMMTSPTYYMKNTPNSTTDTSSSTYSNLIGNYSGFSGKFLPYLYRLCDTTISIDSFLIPDEKPYEFHDIDAIIHIKNLAHTKTLKAPWSSSNKFGIKRDRRKLSIQSLHLPPMESRELTDDVEKKVRGKYEGQRQSKTQAQGQGQQFEREQGHNSLRRTNNSMKQQGASKGGMICYDSKPGISSKLDF